MFIISITVPVYMDSIHVNINIKFNHAIPNI